MDKWQSEAKHSNMKIKNGVRIIDARIEYYQNLLRDIKLRKNGFEKFSPEVLETGTNMFEKMSKGLQDIRDELIPEEKSI